MRSQSYLGRIGILGTSKISVTVEDSALAWLRRRAKLVHGGNLSAAFAEATEVARRQEALRAFLEDDGIPVLGPSELDEITREWRSDKGRVASAKRPKKRTSPRR